MQRLVNREIFLYLMANDNFYDTIDQYQPSNIYKQLVESNIGNDKWDIFRSSMWYNCHKHPERLPTQGWKIHVSATLNNAQEVLNISSKICLARETSFKFGLDETTLLLMNSKGWNRGGSGKFITIYPLDKQDFTSLIAELYEKLKSYEGPYILSDKRYKDCKVLYYRYGGITLERGMSYTGEFLPFIRDPKRKQVADSRNPYFSPPSWVQDPFPDINPIDQESEEQPLLNNRFQIETAVGFSNTGGVYKALDTVTGSLVILKEARSNAGFDTRGNDAVSLLKKEYRLLNKLKALNIAPNPWLLFLGMGTFLYRDGTY